MERKYLIRRTEEGRIQAGNFSRLVDEILDELKHSYFGARNSKYLEGKGTERESVKKYQYKEGYADMLKEVQDKFYSFFGN